MNQAKAELRDAISKQNIAEIRAILVECPHLLDEELESCERNALRFAAYWGKEKSLRALLDIGDVEYRYKKSKLRRNALHLAAIGGSVNCILALLEDCTPDYHKAVDKYGRTVLMWAVACGNQECVTALLKHDPSIEYRSMTDCGYKEETALIYACQKKRIPSAYPMIIELMQNATPSYVNQSNYTGHTALTCVILRGLEAGNDCFLDLLPLFFDVVGLKSIKFVNIDDDTKKDILSKFFVRQVSRLLYLLDEDISPLPYMFWSNDSVVKDVIHWIDDGSWQ
eukprot:TRINITY_DN195561_c0_g1_i2.p1 TRINITY_DN195561_c0_g1~~TRINITY_DN195561_c0_g1_i2.p1  ORF type:complete len:282 (+),score=49.75 TRINITY_DN195561_c0_g1_i2:205-1050(+)